MLACKASAMRLLARQAGESSDRPALPIVRQFSGRGLLPNEIANAPSFVHSVATGAAVTVFTATSLGFPISTTHALIGALVGAGLGQIGAEIYFEKLTQSFLVPLLVSAKVAASLGIVVYKLLQMRSAGRDGVCVVSVEPLPLLSVGRANFRVLTVPNLVVAETTAYENISAQARWSVSDAMDRLHIASALSICFARGVNDTPKLAALLITAKFFNRNAVIVKLV